MAKAETGKFTGNSEKEQTSDYPYKCPECGTDFSLPGSVTAWKHTPTRLAGHIEAGECEDDSNGEPVKFIADGGREYPEIEIHCADCTTDLSDFFVEEILIDPEFEILED